MKTNANLTIFNPFPTNEHDIVYYGAKIRNVWAIYRQITEPGQEETDKSRMIIRVPVMGARFEKKYIEPHLYPTSDPKQFFTFTTMSLAVLDLVDIEEPTSKAYLMENYTIVSITQVADNRYGSAPNSHWRLEGI